MFNKKNFFINQFLKPKLINYNLKKTKKVFNIFKSDLKNDKIPLFNSFEKKYNFSFSKNLVTKCSRYRNIIIIGMGGSILGAKAIKSFFRKKDKKSFFFFDNLDDNLIINYKKIKNLKNSCFIIISKSGNTLEVLTNLSLIFPKSLLKNKLIFITENKNSILQNLAKRLNAEVIEHKEFIGGRYAVLSEVGMFPAALMGLNIKKFKNLKNLINNKKFISTLLYNVTYIYTLQQKKIRNSTLISFNSRLNDLCFWYQQLVGESLGKNGKGITPTVAFGPKDLHSVMQLFIDGPKDKFFTFFSFKEKINKYKNAENIILKNVHYLKNKSLENVTNAQLEATKIVFKSKKIPFRHIIFEKDNESELGKIITFFVLETILLSRLMTVNPFNQPAVELVKKETKKILLD